MIEMSEARMILVLERRADTLYVIQRALSRKRLRLSVENSMELLAILIIKIFRN
jgi:hypothetical protein